LYQDRRVGFQIPPWLLAAFEKRITADYEVEEAMESDDATEMIGQARDSSQQRARISHPSHES